MKVRFRAGVVALAAMTRARQSSILSNRLPNATSIRSWNTSNCCASRNTEEVLATAIVPEATRHRKAQRNVENGSRIFYS
jgi:hypothetical protein